MARQKVRGWVVGYWLTWGKKFKLLKKIFLTYGIAKRKNPFGNSLGFVIQIEDFRLKCCIPGGKSKNRLQEEILASRKLTTHHGIYLSYFMFWLLAHEGGETRMSSKRLWKAWTE
jgi:hypothetical protein